MVGQKWGCLNKSECYRHLIRIFVCILVCISCGSGAATYSTKDSVRLVVYSAPDPAGSFEPVPPDMPLPENITFSLRSPELGFVVVETDPNETVYVRNELLNLPWVFEIEHDAERSFRSVMMDETIKNSSPDQWAMTRMGIQDAWKFSGTYSPCRVSVIDTGADISHPDLDGLVRYGYDWAGQDGNPDDLNGHGTALCGIVATTTGMAGSNMTGPDESFLKIMPERIGTGESSFFSSYSALAIQHAADSGADIILMGYGGPENSLAEERAIDYAVRNGSVLIAPAGNDDSNAMHYPSDDFDVISVGSIASSDGLSYFSNYGIYTELVAPGEDIISPCLNGSYCRGTGTSMAAAEVAGVAALITASYPSLDPDEIRQVLQVSATDLGRSGRDIYYGYGIVTVPAALQQAKEYSLRKALSEYLLSHPSGTLRNERGTGTTTGYFLSLIPD